MLSLLYVDDEPGLLEIGQVFLESTGDFSVTTVLSGKAGLEQLGRHEFDAIISDFQMPEMDGIEFLKKVRQSYGNIPFILFTGRGREEIVIQAINHGADFYLQKGGDPKVQFAELAHKVRQAVSRRQAETALSDSEKRLADIIDFLPDATFAIDNDGKVIAWNRAIEELTGVAAADMLGKGDYEYAVPFYGKRRPLLIDLIFKPEDVVTAYYTDIHRDGNAVSAETDLSSAKGQRIHILAKASPLYNRQGVITGAIEAIRDITEQKKADDRLHAAYEQIAANEEQLRQQLDELSVHQIALRKSEEKFRDIVETSPDLVWEMNTEGVFTYVSPRVAAITGYAPQEVIGRPIFSIIPNEALPPFLEIFSASIRTNRPPIGFDLPLLCRDGRIIIMEIRAVAQADSDGRFVGFRGTARDITEKRRAEEALNESERRFRELADLLPQGVYEADTDGRLTYVNRHALEMFGYSPEDVQNGINVTGTIAPDDRTRVAAAFRRIAEQESVPKVSAEYTALRKNGTTFPIAIFSSPVIRNAMVTGIRGILIDITERKKAEEELRTANEQLAASAEELAGQYDELAHNEERIRISEMRLRFMLGFYEYARKSEKELLEYAIEGAGIVTESPLGYLAFLNEDESELSMYAWSKSAMAECSMKKKPTIYKTAKTGLWGEAVRRRCPVITNDYAAPDPAKKGCPEGHPQIIRHMNVPVIDDGRIVLVAGVANKPSDYSDNDTSELLLLMQGLWTILKRKRTDEIRQESEAKYHDLADLLPQIVFEMDTDFQITFINRQASAALGYTPDDIAAGFNALSIIEPSQQDRIRQNIGRLAEGEPYAHREYLLIRKDGSTFPAVIYADPVYRRGELAGYRGIIIDITERKRADTELQEAYEQLTAVDEQLRQQYEQLKRSEEELQLVKISIDQSAEEVFWLDFKGNILYVNDAACRITGYSRDELLKMKIFELDPDFPPEVWGASVADLRKRKNQHIITRHRRRDGVILDVEIMAVYVNRQGKEFSFAFVRDITDRKKTETALQAAYAQVTASEEELREQYEELAAAQEEITTRRQQLEEIAATVPGVVFQFYARPDGSMGMYYVSSRDSEIFGLRTSLEEFFPAFTSCVHPDDRARFLSSIEDVVKRRADWKFEGRFNKPFGETIWFEGVSSVVVHGNELVHTGIMMDISDRKRTDEALFNSQQMLQAVLDSIPQRVFWKDRNSVFLGCNRPLALDAGYSEPADMVGKTDYDHASHATAELYRADDRQVMETGQPRINYEEPQIRPDGSHAWLRTTKLPLRNKEGTIIGVLGTYEDITERKRAEEALRESEEKYRMLVEHTRDGVYIVQDGLVVFYNRALSDFTGYSPEEMIGKPIAELIAPEFRELVVSRASERAAGKQVPESYECALLHKDGVRRICVRISADTGTYRGRPAAIGVLHDLTEERAREEALRESEAKYRTLVESSFDGIAIHQDGILVYVNQTAARLLGSDDPAVFIGKPALDIVAPAFRDRILDRIRAAPGSPQQVLHEQFLRVDGSLIDVDVASTPGTWKGRSAAFVTFRDITEQKRAEAALRESETRWRQWIEHSPIPIALYRLDGTGLYSNEHYVRITGYTLDEIPNMETYWRTMYPDPIYRNEIKEVWEDLVKTSIARGTYIEPLEARISCRDGSSRILEFTGLVIGDTILVTYYDLTTRKKAEEALLESEEKYRTLVEVNHDIIYSLSTDGIILYASPQTKAQLGYQPEEMTGHTFADFIHPDDIGAMIRHTQEKFTAGKQVEPDQFRVRRKDGSYRWYEDKSIFALDPQGRQIISGTIRDITDEKAVQDALRESEEKYRALVEATSDFIWEVDTHGTYTYVSPKVRDMLGYEPDELVGKTPFDIMPPGEAERVAAEFKRCVSLRLPIMALENKALKKDGSVIILETSGVVLTGKDGSYLGYRGIDRDITRRKQAEDDLREKTEELNRYFTTSLDLFCIADTEGNFRRLNPEWERILGYPLAELEGKSFLDYVHPDDLPATRATISDLARQKQVLNFTNRYRLKDGTYRWIEWRCMPAGELIFAAARDITAHIKAAERTARLSALKIDLIRNAPVEEKLKRITDGIVNIFGADFARIWMSGPGDLCDRGCIHAGVTEGPHVCRNRENCLHLIVSSGRYTHTDGGHRRVPFGAYKIGRIATGEEAKFITNDVTHDRRVHDHAWAESLGLVSFSGFRLLSPEGSPVGVLAFFSREPVTEDIVDDLDDLATTTSQVIQTGMAEEAQRERETWARTILDTAQAGIVLIDAETHRILDANPKALELIGLPRDSVIGAICHRYICPAEEGMCPVTEGGQTVDTSERILLTGAGQEIPVLKTVVPVFLSGKKILVESFVDISEQKRAEAAIQEANRKLNLLSSITRHDVANQLTVIQGYTQLAALKKPEPAIADFLARIESGIDTIQRQIEFTRTYQDLGVQAPSWFIIGDVVRSVRPEGIKLVCPCKSYEIYADPMIGRVFYNLFDNAARYGERVTTVRVGCRKKGKKLVIRFADNGVGIPADEKEKIFSKGYGKHTGYGLFLAREILSITGITIKETGTPSKGALFEITVPEGAYRIRFP